MAAQLIDGKAVAQSVRERVRVAVAARVAAGHRPPALATVLVGEDPASQVYVRSKRKACEELGIRSVPVHFEPSLTQEQLLAEVDRLNADDSVDGILVQMPLPEHIDATQVIERIRPDKDVDGFHPYNLGRLAQRLPMLRPCTPYGVIELLKSVNEPFKRRTAVVVGASNHVGRPMMLELMLAGATATCCHRFTADVAAEVARADIVVVAVGKPEMVKGAWIKPGATVIDIGINRMPDGKLRGDVEFEAARERAAFITPVPGGVGPMTVAMLMQNTLEAAVLRAK
ncbi:bifunctional methylenetetrahydrofolate dehydrogenase/methenyltetrahydrofolate cyclohydrolase FolD [Solimonas sp. K1W22B-7]|uniref:bifunctional methylenetetrahydrofolate dehydrogenase/methenyltetrahydrofolate cyclohydrolase FolD n=1 Tax=Solimonas sp. K1W22B-7 TaxID=2303331 RepID=UPI000E32FA93|nr:bifunctional methylenetetrahydrofolate dehydrogenase/methenyltetrahydrofolate cyclohydrolase FolD [Solimonas sp. K1W22B-7]AXQ29609.1 bifunctional methylenetetrahydrofolate dehydrogenase/methenyltetrahydrofolate cyclohydrolase FolD [Solimonas sp. K1W22B-7]